MSFGQSRWQRSGWCSHVSSLLDTALTLICGPVWTVSQRLLEVFVFNAVLLEIKASTPTFDLVPSSERTCLSKMLLLFCLKPNLIQNALPVYLFHFPSFSDLLLTSNSEWAFFMKCPFQHLTLCSIVNKIWFDEICKLVHSVFIYILRSFTSDFQ